VTFTVQNVKRLVLYNQDEQRLLRSKN